METAYDAVASELSTVLVDRAVKLKHQVVPPVLGHLPQHVCQSQPKTRILVKFRHRSGELQPALLQLVDLPNNPLIPLLFPSLPWMGHRRLWWERNHVRSR